MTPRPFAGPDGRRAGAEHPAGCGRVVRRHRQGRGSKLWRYEFRIGGVEGLQALGGFPEVGLADARAAHTASRHLVAKGINPVHARRKARESRAFDAVRRAKDSFEAVYREWDEATSAALSAGTAMQRRHEIEKDLLPAFQVRIVASVTRRTGCR